MKQLLVILGSTSTGKTKLALKLAAQLRGEIIACDSRQVYRGLNIGTGKLSGDEKEVKVENNHWQIDGVTVHLYDQVDLNQQFSVNQYVTKATGVISQVDEENKLPIVVGGTGHYLKGLLKGFETLRIPVDQDLRDELLKLSVFELQERLKNVSKQKWLSLNDSDRQNYRRLVRAIEVSMHPKSQIKKDIGLETRYQVLKIGLFLPRGLLYQKISHTVDDWLDNGILDEVKQLKANGLSTSRLREIGLNYRVLADFLEGKIKHDILPEKIKQQVRNYAKRQLTWFKKESSVNWFDVSLPNWSYKVEKLIRLWYHEPGKTYDQKS